MVNNKKKNYFVCDYKQINKNLSDGAKYWNLNKKEWYRSLYAIKNTISKSLQKTFYKTGDFFYKNEKTYLLNE